MIKRENENVNFNVTPPKENTVLFFPPILESQAPKSSKEAQLLAGPLVSPLSTPVLKVPGIQTSGI